jgi:hypothetical protein
MRQGGGTDIKEMLMKGRIWIHKVLYRLGLRKWPMAGERIEGGDLVYVRQGVMYKATSPDVPPDRLAVTAVEDGGYRVTVILQGGIDVTPPPDVDYYMKPLRTALDFERAVVEVMALTNAPEERVAGLMREQIAAGATVDEAQEIVLAELWDNSTPGPLHGVGE